MSGASEGGREVRTEIESGDRHRPFHIPWLLGFCIFAAIALVEIGHDRNRNDDDAHAHHQPQGGLP
jgi:hypothetical protein